VLILAGMRLSSTYYSFTIRQTELLEHRHAWPRQAAVVPTASPAGHKLKQQEHDPLFMLFFSAQLQGCCCSQAQQCDTVINKLGMA
jgi:hypothetical protein